MSNSSVFIFLMLRALYRMICKDVKSFFDENSLNVTNVKLFRRFRGLVDALKKAPKSQNNSKFIKEQEVLRN